MLEISAPLSSRTSNIETLTASPDASGVAVKTGVDGTAGATGAVIGVAFAAVEVDEVPTELVADALKL